MRMSSGGCRLVFWLVTLVLLGSSARCDEQVRKWRDKSGRFEVEAKLVKYADGEAQLLKTDGRMVKVAVTALSEADQEYLKSLAESENPFAGGELMNDSAAPAATSSRGNLLSDSFSPDELPADGPELFLTADARVPSLEPDPATSVAAFQQFTRPLERLDAYARTSSPVLIDPQTPVFAVSAHRVGNTVQPDSFGRLYLVSPEQTQSQVVLDLPDSLLLFDHHLPSGRTLVALGVDSPSERGGDLTLLEGVKEGQPRAVARGACPGGTDPASNRRSSSLGC